MLNCKRCRGRMFVDRVFTNVDHLEIFCINCGYRKIFHPPSKFGALAQWLNKMEIAFQKMVNGK